MSGAESTPTAEMYTHRHDVLCDDVGDASSDTTIVFSHGTLMNRTMFRPQLDALKNECRVVAYDSRSRTERWEGPYSLDDLANDCLALVDALDIDSFVLAGMSMGGYMALR
ncbi:MAG: alpha/beta hydrolase, partial [Halobacteria archaeon]|nr:alpha/beta hydrolase [Halobacteria archaeon]